MRALANLHSSFLDFVENTRVGSAGFRLARFGVFALLIFAGSKIAAGQFLAFELADVVFMGITVLALLAVYLRWEIGIAGVLATTSFIAYYDAIPTLSLYHFIPEIPILEDLRLLLGQGIMLFMLAVFLTSLEARTLRERLATPLAPAVLMFMVAILITSMIGLLFNNVYLSKMIETSRSYSFYLMFFVTLLCLRERRNMRVLLTTLLVMAVIVAIMMFVQFAAGNRFQVFFGNIRVESFGSFAGRILPPGVELIWMVVPFVIARIPIVTPHARRWLVAALAVLFGGLLLTFTRSVWMGTLLSMTIMAIMGRGPVRVGVLRMFVAMGAFVAVLLVVLQLVSTDNENYMTPYVKRFTSIFKAESYEEGSSANVRKEEILAAWPKIVEKPWFGVGVGGTYAYIEAWDDRDHRRYWQPVTYIHNAYVLLLTHTGIVGFTTCMIMLATFFVRARNIFKQLTRPDDRATVMAGIGAIASVMLASMMQPSLWYPPAVPCIGTIFGLVEVTRYFAQRERAAALAAARGAAIAHPRPHLQSTPAATAVMAQRVRRARTWR
jgi:O-antigen ligase